MSELFVSFPRSVRDRDVTNGIGIRRRLELEFGDDVGLPQHAVSIKLAPDRATSELTIGPVPVEA